MKKASRAFNQHHNEKRISFLGHIFRIEDKRLLSKSLEFFWYKKFTLNWIKDVKKDIEELNITIADLKTKSETTRQ